MHATARRPLWVRVGAGLLAAILFLTNTVYPWISLLPAPPIVVAQEESPLATTSAEATPAASVATPAPSPLDPLDNLDQLLLPSSPSAEILLPEDVPEATPSASPTPIPESTPEDQILPPSPTPSPSESPTNNSTDLQDDGLTDSLIHGSTDSRDDGLTDSRIHGLTNTPLPPLLSPFSIRLAYPFVGSYPISYGFGETSGSSYVRLMQTLFKVDAHDGLDFAMPEGTIITSTDDGEVIHAGRGIYGETVIIKHSWGNSYYGHLSDIKVATGARVLKGELIALSGSTGISTGPHLHFGIRPNHYDPFNGYHGMVDPLPYLSGTVLGGSTSTKYDLIHLPYKTLASDDPSLSIPVLATASGLTYRLTNPKGESKIVYPSIYNYGTGDTAILPRPTPFVPGEYELTVTDVLGNSDSVRFSWGVVTLNTNQSRYILGQDAMISLAVLDELGEMVCDADLILSITSPNGTLSSLTTDNKRITTNLEVCKSKDLTLTPDYVALFTPSEVGSYALSLTAITPKHTFTITDSFEVHSSLPYTLERQTATRIFPGNVYPVILKLKANNDISSQLTEVVPKGFNTSPATASDFAQWLSTDETALFDSTAYTRRESDQNQSLSWDINLGANQTKIFGYTYDAPDESPALYSLGPISYAGETESRQWNIAIDGVDPTLGAFAPQTGVAWTSADDANLNLRQPNPKNGDLMIATIAIRPSSITVNTPTGWTLVDSQTGTDGGAEGADTGSVALYWFSKVADGTEGTANLTFTETGTTSVWIGQIIKIRSSTGTYSLSSGGYSINADATNWNGTLDTDIGTKDGDLILIAGAQNGDLSNTSAWNISATNLTTKSTVNEYFEGTTATGNDLEVGLAETLIWEGNNTTTPTITLTQSVAASGAVMALRIRQGSGTNRTDTWVRSSGPFAVGTTSVAPAYPHHNIGDMLILVVGSRGTTDPTPTTPAGWTLIGSSYNGGAGTFAADAGNARITTYSREATSRLTGTQSVTITSGNTAHGQIYAINRDNAEGWTISSGGGTDTTAGTGYSVTTSSVSLDSASGGDVVLIASSINTDAYTYTTLSLTQSGSTISTPVEEAEYRGSTGNDMGLHVASTEVTSGSGSGAATFSMTASGSTANAPAGATIAIKILGTAQTVASKAVGFFTPPATWTSAANANLTLTYPDPRNGDLMLAITAIRPAASTVDTPAGWTLVDSRTGTDGGAEGADTGSVGIYIFSKTSDGTEGTGTLAFTETGTTSVWIGNIMKLRSGTGTYSVSGSGYSLNADTVTWGSTLGADIGLTNGDVVLLAAAQNGDLSATSAWDISATSVTQKSTFNEHGEFGSTTGNAVEVGLASGIIWGGTNTATPTLTLTQSVAVSGVVSAIRIRENTGTQRTDTWVRSAGAQVVSTTTTLSLVYPEHEVGDMFVMFVSTRGTSNPTLLAPYGWTSLGSYNGGAGTFGVDAGNARVTAYYREATSRRWGTQSVILTSADVAIGQIIAIHTKNIDTWSIDSDGGTDTSAGTGWSVTGSGIDLSSTEGGDVILVGSAINTDAYTYTSHALSASGITFGEVTQTATYNTSSGNDSNLTILTSRVTAGSGSNLAPTTTMTASGSTANAPAGSALFVKIVGIPTVIEISGTANGNNGATVKVALGASVQAQSTTISSGTWTISDVAHPSVGTVVTVWVDGVADSLESTAATIYNAAPISGLVLNTNVLTLGSNQDQSLSIANLNSYDCTEDEDVMHQAASSHLKVEGDACAGSTTNSYTSEKLTTLSGDTLTVATSDTITTYDLENAGTITVTGNGTLNVSHNWANTGTFTAGTSTVNLTGADSTTQTISGSTTFYNLTASTTTNSAGRTIRYTAGTTTTISGTWTMTGATSKILTLESSTTSAWTINPTSASVSYADISYSTNTGVAFCATYSNNGGNNTGWSITDLGSCPVPVDLGYSHQRKTWHDGTRYWRSYLNTTDNRIEFEYSTDGTTWTENTNARVNIDTSDFATHADSSYAYLAYPTSNVTNTDNLVNSGLVGYWKMNESSWTGSAGEVLDASGNSFHGTRSGNATTTTGKLENGGTFDGSGDYVTVADNAALRPGTGNWTISTWIKPADTPQNITPIFKFGGSTGWGMAIGGDVDGGSTGRKIVGVFQNGSNYRNAITNSDVTDANWHHVALVWNSSSDSLTIYVDGTSVAITTDYGGSWPNMSNTDALTFGTSSVVNDYNGLLDDVRLYNRAVTAGEIEVLATPGYDIETRSAVSYPGTNWSWGTETVALNGSSSSDFFQHPTLTRDSNSRIWIASTNVTGSNYDWQAIRSTNTSSITEWDNPTTLDSSTNNNKYGLILPRLSGNMQSIWIDGTALESKNYNGSWDGSPTSVGTGNSGLATSMSGVTDSSGSTHLIYVNSSTGVSYQTYSSSWSTVLTLDSTSGSSYPTISINTSNDDLFALWINSNDISYVQGSSPYGASDWDSSPTTWQNTGTNTSLSSSYSASGEFFAQWEDDNTIEWDKLSFSNTAPNSPTSLAQMTTSDVSLSTGDWHNSTSIKFSATATDSDNPDTLQLCIEIDQIGNGFSNTEDSCGSGASYSGSGVTVSHTLTVTDAQEYHWQARIKDAGGLYSAWVSYGANAESARDVGVDTTAPTGGTVYDGSNVGVDTTFATSSLSSLSANWDSFNTNVSGLARYDYSIGTSAGATDIKTWTDNNTSTSVTATGLTLQTSQVYYFNVRAVDNAGNVQSAVSSNGQLVSPSISFSITPATTTFSNLGAGNSYTDTEVTTLTTSTNAYNGYIIRAFTTDLLKTVGGTHQIENFSAGSYASPASWSGSETGFGYTSSDTSIQGSDKFAGGTLFAPFSQTGPGDIVADHTSSVTGTSISNESFNITYKVKVPSSQAAANYTSTVVYTATAQY